MYPKITYQFLLCTFLIFSASFMNAQIQDSIKTEGEKFDFGDSGILITDKPAADTSKISKTQLEDLKEQLNLDTDEEKKGEEQPAKTVKKKVKEKNKKIVKEQTEELKDSQVNEDLILEENKTIINEPAGTTTNEISETETIIQPAKQPASTNHPPAVTTQPSKSIDTGTKGPSTTTNNRSINTGTIGPSNPPGINTGTIGPSNPPGINTGTIGSSNPPGINTGTIGPVNTGQTYTSNGQPAFYDHSTPGKSVIIGEVSPSTYNTEEKALNLINSLKLIIGPATDYPNDVNRIPIGNESVYKTRLDVLPTTIPMTYNAMVGGFIEMYVVEKREQVKHMLAKTDLYFKMMDEILLRHEMPVELKSIAVIESALIAKLKTRDGKAGLWGLPYGTAQMYGLEANAYIDERMDPRLATEVAVVHLKKSV